MSSLAISSSLSSSIFGQVVDEKSTANYNDNIKSSNTNLLISLFESSSKLPSKRNLIPPPAVVKSNRKKKKVLPDGEEVISTENIRKRKTDDSSNGKQIIVSDGTTTSKRKKPKKVSSEIGVEEGTSKTNDTNNNEESNKESTDTTITSDKREGENDDEVANRTIFVGNLPLSITRKKLTSIFSKCGKVESTRIRSVAVKGVKLPPQSAGNQVCQFINYLFLFVPL